MRGCVCLLVALWASSTWAGDHPCVRTHECSDEEAAEVLKDFNARLLEATVAECVKPAKRFDPLFDAYVSRPQGRDVVNTYGTTGARFQFDKCLAARGVPLDGEARPH